MLLIKLFINGSNFTLLLNQIISYGATNLVKFYEPTWSIFAAPVKYKGVGRWEGWWRKVGSKSGLNPPLGVFGLVMSPRSISHRALGSISDPCCPCSPWVSLSQL